MSVFCTDPAMGYGYNTVLTSLCPIIPQVIAYRRLKTKENVKLLALKVIAVTYERWLLPRGSKYRDLTGKHLIFWKTGR